jgi:hypothetical protein
MLWSSNDVTQQGSRPKTKLGHHTKAASMNTNPRVDLIQLAREHVDAHDELTWKNFDAFRTELNEDHVALGKLRIVDLKSEIQLGQKIFAALLNEHGHYRCHPHVLAAGFVGHMSRLETRNNLYTAFAAIFGAATAIWSLEGKDALPIILTLGVLTIAPLIAKWNNDKYLSLVRRVVAHLQSFSPNIAVEKDAPQAARLSP